MSEKHVHIMHKISKALQEAVQLAVDSTWGAGGGAGACGFVLYFSKLRQEQSTDKPASRFLST